MGKMRRWARGFTVGVGVFCSAGFARAATYRWVDKDGVHHITSTPPEKGTAVGTVKATGAVPPPKPKTPLKKYSEAGTMIGTPYVAPPPPVAPAAPSKPAAPPTTAKGTPHIEIYSAPWCGYCRLMKSYLQKKGFAYTEYDVDTDAAAAERLGRLNPDRGIPVMVIDGQVIVGFYEPQLEKVLAQYR